MSKSINDKPVWIPLQSHLQEAMYLRMGKSTTERQSTEFLQSRYLPQASILMHYALGHSGCTHDGLRVKC